MKPISTVLSVLGIVAALAPSPAHAQQLGTGKNFFDLNSQLTQDEFAAFTAELGTLLRFRQVGDNRTLGKGKVDLGVQFTSSTMDDSYPQVVGRFGVNNRVDFGAWGGYNARAHYGLVGADAQIMLISEATGRPVSFSIRPSVTSLVGPSEVWGANASIDLTVSKTFGRISPYAGVATTGSIAIERSKSVDLDPAVDEGSLSYAGITYRWRTMMVSGEIEKGDRVTYAFRVGKRF